ncbi:glycosyltransferase [Paenibacillus solisilvae]|uniref:4,4'-diaponeurosporenoate glycosyltransferase n=1 Tax=Paenibacillus solisilvae TaxID=2486751 RepID=A0ABW0VVG7_9BACL
MQNIAQSKVICVLGMHRSGTSAITRAINYMGAYIGKPEDLVPPLDDNPEGFWEFQEFVAINDRVLGELNSCWDAVNIYPENWWTLPSIALLKEEIKEIIKKKFSNHKLWVFKDPRTSILLPMWKEIFNELKIEANYVITVRNPMDVVASLAKRNGYSLEKSLALWTFYTINSLYWTQDENRVIVGYDSFLDQPDLYIDRFKDSFQLEFDRIQLDEKLKSFLKPSLRHSKTSVAEFISNENYSEMVRELFKITISYSELRADHSTNKSIEKMYHEFILQRRMWAHAGKKALIQVFYLEAPDQDYAEERSVIGYIDLEKSNAVQSLSLPGGIIAPLRIDMTNVPAAIHIESIQLVTQEEHPQVIGFWSKHNGFQDVLNGQNLIRFSNASSFQGITTSTDPYIYVQQFNENEFPSKLTIRMDHYPLTQEIVDSVSNHIHGIEYTASELNIQLIELKQQITEFENKFKKSEALLVEKEREISELNVQLISASDTIAQNEAVQLRLDKEIAITHALKEQNRLLEEQIHQKDVEQIQFKTRIADIQHDYNLINYELNGIYQSNGWSFLKKYYKLRESVMPVGSPQRKASKVIVNFRPYSRKLLRHVNQYGVPATLRKIKARVFPTAVTTGKVVVPTLALNRAKETKTWEYDFTASSQISVSVVIPTINAGQEFELLLAMLSRQKGFKQVEIVIVDSGSTDMTLDLAKEYNVTLVRIKPEDFSHSYARNLGAETAASDDYLLIMTQDALPTSDYWLFELYAASEKNDFAAVSCAESSREDVDLFYRVICWSHYRFLGVIDNDRIMEMPDSNDYHSLRFNAQLSDVTCLIKKDIFMNYKYRFDYAEDLDLGLRLIRDGYKIGLLGQTKVIHSHKRLPYYHLKRGFVDNLFMHQFFDDYAVPKLYSDNLERDLVYTYSVLTHLINSTLADIKHSNSIEKLSMLTYSELDSAILRPYDYLLRLDKCDYVDDKTHQFVEKLFEGYLDLSYRPMYNGDGSLLHALKGFVEVVFEYMKLTYEILDEELLNEFKWTLMKGYAIQLGTHLSHCYVGSEANKERLSVIHNELTKGV